MPTVRERLENDLRGAMRARDQTLVSILRTTLAALSNAEAVDNGNSTGVRVAHGLYAGEAQRRELTDAACVAIIERERLELLSAVEEYERGGQLDAARELRAKAAALDVYLR